MKKIICAVLCAAILAASLCVSVCAETFTATVDFDTTYQTIDGWGASYTWYGDWLTTNVNAEQGYDWIFSDAEFNILRFRDLNHVGNEYQNALDGYPAYKAYYDAAIARGIDPIVLVTSWGQYDRDLPFVEFNELSDKGYSYYTLAKDENGEYMYDELAQFCVQSVQYFYDAGIDVDYFSISNEIELQERHIDEQGKAREEAGFFLGPEETDDYCAYWKAHIAVYEAFKEAFGEYAPVLLGAETMAGYEDLLHSYLDPIIENCPESLEIIGHHLYGTDRSPANFSKVGNAFWEDYTIWQTEWYYNDYFGHAETMIDELVYENISAYLYWNGVWIADTGNCLIEIGGASGNDYIQRIGNHYIMTHFSKYIKNGYQRVDVQYDSDVKLAAFKSPDSSKLVVVALNKKDSESVDITFDLGDKKILASNVIQSFEGENRFRHDYLVDMGEYDDDFLLPAGSLSTFVFDLEPDPNYVAPAAEEAVNPFVKQPEPEFALDPMLLIAAVAVVIIAAGVVVIILALKKKKN